MWRRTALCTLLLAVFLPVTPPVAAATAEVVIDDGVRPVELTVASGTAVTWRNADDQRHRVRTTAAPVELDSGNLEPGMSFTATLTAPGTYRYVDDRDRQTPAYWGTITVTVGSPAPAPPPGGVKPGTPPPPGAPAPAPAAPSAPSSASVSIASRAFSPASVRIAAGGTVDWSNQDDRAHTVTARDASFDSGIMAGGQRFARSFAQAGTFTYFCAVHPEMTGTVEVVGASSTAPPAAAPSAGPVVAAAPPAAPSAMATGAGEPATAAVSARAPATGAAVPAASPTAAVSVVDFAFQPAVATVAVGGTVTWTNRGVAPHTVTATDGTFDSGIVAAGRSFSFRFPRTGTFSYRCNLHPQMQGTVTVRADDRAAPSLPSGRTSPPPGAAEVTGDSVPAEPGDRSRGASSAGRTLATRPVGSSDRSGSLAIAAAVVAFVAGAVLGPRFGRLRARCATGRTRA